MLFLTVSLYQKIRKSHILVCRTFTFLSSSAFHSRYFSLTMQSNQSRRKVAMKRLRRDLVDLQRADFCSIAAQPDDTNFFEWHVNIRANEGVYSGYYFHFILTFPHSYPADPPHGIYTVHYLPVSCSLSLSHCTYSNAFSFSQNVHSDGPSKCRGSIPLSLDAASGNW